METLNESQNRKIHKESPIDSCLQSYKTIRQKTLNLCAPLELEDYIVQSAPHVSPPKWHLAHTTWFFERFILSKYAKGYETPDPIYDVLFNSYYKSLGSHWQQSERGVLSRPTVNEVLRYRSKVDEAMGEVLNAEYENKDVLSLLEVGLHHEQQHQELLLMDVLFNFSQHPFSVEYSRELSRKPELKMSEDIFVPEGLYSLGHDTVSGFGYDNEYPRHRVYINGCKLNSDFVTNGEYLDFIENGGYKEASLWLSEGWDWVENQRPDTRGFHSPLYWQKKNGRWYEMSLAGESGLNLEAPVSHINFYEASAYSQYVGQRLPTEQEWEVGTQLNSNYDKNHILWQWTQSSYQPYPGYQRQEGALGEYNGKFMTSQVVLRGGCFATPRGHYRPTYRNFYYPSQRWMFSGIRLAKDLKNEC